MTLAVQTRFYSVGYQLFSGPQTLILKALLPERDQIFILCPDAVENFTTSIPGK